MISGLNRFINQICLRYNSGKIPGYDLEKQACIYSSEDGVARCGIGIMLPDNIAKLMEVLFTGQPISNIYRECSPNIFIDTGEKISAEQHKIKDALDSIMSEYELDIDELQYIQETHDNFMFSNPTATGEEVARAIWTTVYHDCPTLITVSYLEQDNVKSTS